MTPPLVLGEARAVRLVVDVLGREIAVLADGERPAGAHTVRLIPGAYVVRAELSGQAAARTLLVTR